MILKLLNDETIEFQGDSLIKYSKTISDMVECLELDQNIAIPIQTTKTVMSTCLGYLNNAKKINEDFHMLNELLLLCDFLQIKHLYQECCKKLYLILKYKTGLEVLDLYNFTDSEKEKMLSNEDFTLDLYCNRERNYN